ncbi:MAG: response regulator [Candidatus Omnitrophica bacterium]|jgi:two-component system response regulator (stage 0 sporulation protein F)|nr:response regulator [Candidatus Omnitrophota bacterium]
MGIERKKVLIVDDEIEIADFLGRFLQRLGITAIKANSGEEALRKYNEEHPDSIFLDIQMPDKDGITILKEIKKIDSAVKIIMITGKDDKDLQAKAKKYGALDYITKPLDLSELSIKINNYIL